MIFDPSKLVDGPFVITFTARIPFPIFIPNELGHQIRFDIPYKEDWAEGEFGIGPFVNIRVFDLVESGLPLWQRGTHEAIESFYGVQLDSEPEKRYGENVFLEHNQWVTLETPYAAMGHEDPAVDGAFAFHRCLSVFNLFLQAVQLITHDVRIRRVSSRDFRPVMVMGALPKGQKWRVLTVMTMHPDAPLEGTLAEDKPFTQDELNDGLHAIITNAPYLNTIAWRSRAQRSYKFTGDAADAVISFQIAAESLLFDTYRMLLIDERLSSADITAELGREIPFKTLLTKKLPSKLGGQWDITCEGTAVGDYWKKLYTVRNLIIHSGLQPDEGYAGQAQTAYWSLRDHLEERLWVKHKTYPRAFLARFGEEQLRERGWLTAEVQRFAEQAHKEPKPYYWPYDLAGR